MGLSALKLSWGSKSGGIVVEFAFSTSVTWGSWVQLLGTDLHTSHQAMLWGSPIYKNEEDLSSGTVFLMEKNPKRNVVVA